jgi:hypothetical protein
MDFSLLAMICMAGLISTAPEAQAVWLGQPSHDFSLPAPSDLIPGQC